MKKSVLVLFIFLLTSGLTYAQLTGSKTIPGDYVSVAAAIADLNTAGVGTGGVIFNIAAGHTETFSSVTAGLITATGTASSIITFQKEGSGINPVITAATPGTGTKDYIFCIGGGDYITFDGINIQENPANLGAESWMEYGFAIFKASDTDGAQHNIIRNSSISLSGNLICFGIYLQNWAYTTPGTLVTTTSLSGTNSWNKFYNLTFSTCYNGINLDGFNDVTPFSFYDQGNEVGVDGPNSFNGLASPGSTAVCYGIYVRYQNNIKLANNTFTGNVPMANGNLWVMYLHTATNANVDVYNNTISMNYTGTGSFGGLYCNGLGVGGTTNAVNFHHNRVINNSLPNLTTMTSSFMYIVTGGVNASFYANEVSNNVIGSATATATAILYYCNFQSNPTTPGTTTINDNVVSNNSRIQSVAAGGSTYLFNTNHTGNLLNVYNNHVSDIITGSTGFTYGFYNTGGGLVANYYNNSITNISNVKGLIYCYYSQMGSGNYSHYNNKISNIGISSGVGPLYGIYQSNTGGAIFKYYNNFISELRAPSSAATIHGMNINGGSTNSIFNNTIYLDATSTGSPFNVTGIWVSTTPTVDMRNNIVVNVSTPTGSGRAVVYQRSNTTLTTYASTSNNNNFYAGLPGSGNLIFYDGTNSDVKLPNYKDRVSPRDGMTVTENPPFINVTANPYDLHIRTAMPTQCESAASIVSSPVNLTNDYDNDWRYPNAGYPDNILSPASAPDMGADEFGGLALDLTPPAIVLTPLKNTSSTLERTLIATITDAAGVPVSGPGLPVLYWKINSGVWNSYTGLPLGGSQYIFSLGTGVALNDVISYYIAAQDMLATPNTGSYPGGEASGFTPNPPACATPPGTPLQYTIVGSLSGIYPVGVGQVYATLTAAIADLSVKEVTGAVTFELWDPLYSISETFPLVINDYLGSNVVNTVTFRPKAGVTTVITGSSATGLIRLNGCQYIILDGSDGINPGRNMTFENTSSTNLTFTIGLFRTGNVGASNCTIRNCLIKSFPHLTLDTYGIRLDPSGGGYDNIVIDNNQVFSARIGIQVSGSQNIPATNCRITNNIVGSTINELALTRRGIYLLYASNTLVEGNDIMGPADGNTVVVQTGMMINQGTPNTRIIRNKIHDWYYTGTGAIYGIYYQGVNATTVTEISNNLFYNIKSQGGTSASTGIYGIYLVNGGNLKIHHNSIYLAGQITSPTSTSQSAPIWISSGVTLLDIRNNILVNSLTPVSGTPASKNYAIVNMTGSPAVFSHLDYNDYYVNGYNPNIGYQGSDFTTLPDWQTATGQEAHGRVIDPIFASPTNLVPTNSVLGHLGLYLASVPQDITGITRTDPPDMGTYEFTADPLVVTNEALSITGATATLNGTINANVYTVNSYFDFGLTSDYGNTIAGTPPTVSGSSTIAISAGLTGLLPLTTYHFRIRGVAGTLNAFGSDMTFTTLECPLPAAAGSITGPASVCSGGTGYVYSIPPIANVSAYNWTLPFGGTITAGANTNIITVSFSGDAVSGEISVYGINSCGTGPASPNLAVTVNPLPIATIGGSGSVCYGANETAYFTESGMTNYNWNVSAGGTIVYGLGTSFILVNWTTSGAQTVSVNYSTSAGCTAANAIINVMVYQPFIAGTISGSQTICYSEDPPDLLTGIAPTGGSVPYTYQWESSADGLIFTDIVGATILDYQPGVLQQTTYFRLKQTSYDNCGSVYTNMVTITVYPALVPGSAQADQTINYNTVPAPLTAVSLTGGQSPYIYQWMSSLDGISFNAIDGATDLIYLPGALTTTTYYKQIQTSGGNCGSVSTNIITITVNPNPIPVNLTLEGLTISSGQTNCYNASQTIYVAGSGTTFVVQNGGSVTMIAGQNIIYYPGTTIHAGGYMHAYVAPNGPWCNTPSNPIVNHPGDGNDIQTSVAEMLQNQNILIYPNPSAGAFILDVKDAFGKGKMTVEIYGISGTRVLNTVISGQGKHGFSLSGKPSGLYLIRVTSSDKTANARLVIH